MSYMMLLLIPTWFTIVSGYGECAKHILTQDYSSHECLLSSNIMLSQFKWFQQNKDSYQILAKDLQEEIINKAVPKCLIVTHNAISTIDKSPNNQLEDIVPIMSNVRAKSKCLLLPREQNLEEQKYMYEGRFHNFDILIVPLKNTSGQIVWKKSYQRKFKYYNPATLTDTRHVLEVARVAFQPFYIPSKDGNVVGIDASSWEIIETHLKLKVTFLDANNNGATVQMVKHGQAHVSGVQLIFSHNWYAGNDITPPMFQRDISLYAKYPDLKSRYQTLLGPLNFLVWMAVLNMIICTGLVLLLSDKCLGENNISWFGTTLPSYSVLISESMPYHVMYANMNVSKWTLLSFLIPLSTLLSYAYRSNLLASLIGHEYEDPVDTYQDIIDRDMTIYLIKGTTVLPLFANSPNPTVVQAYKHNMIEKGGLYTSDNGETPARVWDDLNSGKGIIVRPKERLMLYIRSGKDLNLGSFICGYYLNMGHPLNSQLATTIQSLVESGIYQKLVDHYVWVRQTNLRFVKRGKVIEDERWTKLGNGHILPVYVMSAFLIAISFIAFAVDFCMVRHKDAANKVIVLQAYMAKLIL